jgi:hypothetical protein
MWACHFGVFVFFIFLLFVSRAVLTVRTLVAPGSSVAMILNTRGVNVNPGSLNSWLDSNGGYADGCDIYWCARQLPRLVSL